LIIVRIIENEKDGRPKYHNINVVNCLTKYHIRKIAVSSFDITRLITSDRYYSKPIFNDNHDDNYTTTTDLVASS